MHPLRLGLILCLLPIFCSAQRVITGTVLDLNDIPLEGAHIIVNKNNEGVISDKKGYFQLLIYPGESTMKVSLPNYQTQTVKIEQQSDYTIYLKKSDSGLDTILTFDPEAYEEQIQVVRRDGRAVAEEENNYNPVTYGMESDEAFFPPGFNTEDYSSIQENNEKNPLDAPLSTFSIDVDKASYSNMRRFLTTNQVPPKDAIRVEELINYFDYNYTPPGGKVPFAVHTELSDCPWNKNKKLLHIGLKGQEIDRSKLPASNLVFLLDVSGSMNSPNKLGLLKKSFEILVNQLQADDQVAIVVYAGAAGLVLPSTSGADKSTILSALKKLSAGGSTAGGAGIELAYQVAKESFIEGGSNRVILATDGDFNVGQSSDGALAQLIEEKRKSGIFLTVLGFGMGNYKDNKLEILADKGNGNYAYIDSEQEGKNVFENDLLGTLYTIAKDVKIQIEFNPGVVENYRLIGYENRILEAEDFANDLKDAGELGVGHTVTALYELKLKKRKAKVGTANIPLRYQQRGLSKKGQKAEELGVINLRYKAPDKEVSELISSLIQNQSQSINKASDNFRFSAAVASMGLLLRESKYVSNLDYNEIYELAKGASADDKFGYRSEFLDLLKKAEDLFRTNR